VELVLIERQELDLPRIPLQPYHESMFDIYCPTHRSRMLLGPDHIEALTNTHDGPIIEWRCFCGTRGTHSFGRRPRTAQAA
jgi:hypothetical protein